MKKNGLEWSVFGAGLALILALVAYLALQAAGGAKGEARFRVRLGRPERVEGGYQTRATVENLGDETAMGVKVEVGDADFDLDYVPRRSEREGVVVTEEKPQEGRVVSWQSP